MRQRDELQRQNEALVLRVRASEETLTAQIAEFQDLDRQASRMLSHLLRRVKQRERLLDQMTEAGYWYQQDAEEAAYEIVVRNRQIHVLLREILGLYDELEQAE
jgi:ribosomal protein L18